MCKMCYEVYETVCLITYCHNSMLCSLSVKRSISASSLRVLKKCAAPDPKQTNKEKTRTRKKFSMLSINLVYSLLNLLMAEDQLTITGKPFYPPSC